MKRVYAELSGVKDKSLTPKDIFDIAEGIKEGDRQAAVASFGEMGEMAGSAIASALNIVDGLVVIGGGLAGASRYSPGIDSRTAFLCFHVLWRNFPLCTNGCL